MSFFKWLLRKKDPKPPSFADTLVEIAMAEVGVEEVDGTNCGPRVNLYKAATWMSPTQPWPWCSAFVCWVVRMAMLARGVHETETFKRPTTPRAYGLEGWSRSQDSTTSTKLDPGQDIKPGDIVIFTFSHTGFAIAKPKGGYVDCVEGNTDEAGGRTGGKVMVKRRPLHQIRSRIRFNLP